MNEYLLSILDYFKKNYLSIIAIAIGISGIILTICLNIKTEDPILDDNQVSDMEVSTQEESEVNELIRVDVKGEVNNPGVYEMDTGSIILDAINKAGGLTKKGSTSDINLSKALENEMVITVLAKSDSKSVSNKTSNNSVKANSKVSINTGTLSDLMTLSGIGEAKAKSIISYREKNGLFKTIEDIKNVTGIGDALFAKIKEDITT